MKLARYTQDGQTRLGIIGGDGIVALTEAICPYTDMVDLLAAGRPALDALAAWLPQAAEPLPLAAVHLEAPIARPPKFLAIGLNYADHIDETDFVKPDFPMFFNKQSTCVNGPYDPIHMPRVSTKLDYEGELGVVIGRRCRHVPRDRAGEVVAGYLIVNDVSVRDWQARSATFTLGKSFDTHGPIGPWITTPDEVGDPHRLDFRTLVSGKQRQSSNTRHMIFNIWEQIEVLSTAFTLEPGDIIATGTCAGVGFRMKPRGYLKIGDTVRVEIDRLGYIENSVIAEPADTDRI